MKRPSAPRLLASLVPLLVFQALFQFLQMGDRRTWGWPMPWPNELVWQIVLVSSLVAIFSLLVGIWVKFGNLSESLRRISSGYPPTASLLPPVYTLAVLSMMYGPVPDGRLSRRETLAASLAIALSCWTVFAVWRGVQASARGVAPELYESLKSEYLALCKLTLRPVSQRVDTGGEPRSADTETDKSALEFGTPAATDRPLPSDRLDAYLLAVGLQLGFEEDYKLPVGFEVSPRAWNSGSAYLEAQRRLAHVRDSQIAHAPDKVSLLGQAFALELRLSGGHLGDTALLMEHLKSAKANIVNDTDLEAQAETLFTIASTISSYVYSRRRALVRVQMQQHWLVVLVQMIAALILSIVVLAGAGTDTVGAAVILFLIGAGSGILSLLHVRQSDVKGDLGDDYGLFRVELARAFTLSGMAALIGVFLMANLPVLADTGVFDPLPSTSTTTEIPSPAKTPSNNPESATPEATSPPESSPAITMAGATGSLPSFQVVSRLAGVENQTRSNTGPFSRAALFQNVEPTAVPTPAPGATDPAEEWRPLDDIFAFSNLGGFLVALLAGWVPERVFRSLTSYGNRLRFDIQSVSRAGN